MLEWCERDDAFRAALHETASWLVEKTKPGDQQHLRQDASKPPPRMIEKTLQMDGQSWTTVVPVSDDEPLPPSIPGQESPSYADGPYVTHEMLERASPTRPVDLALLIKRCRLKAEALHWAIERRRRKAEGADHRSDIQPGDAAMGVRARDLPDCNLWMLSPYADLPDDAALERVAGNYETVAMCGEVIRFWLGTHDEPPPAQLLDLAAEAQSALRVELLDQDIKYENDQFDLFSWVREQARIHRIYIDRYMQLDDKADPSQWRRVQSELETLRNSWENVQNRERQRNSLINTLRYEAQQLHSGDDDRRLHHWKKIDAALSEWIESGNRHSDRRITDILIDLVDDVPEEFEPSDHCRHVLMHLDRVISEREEVVADTPAQRAESEEVVRVRELIAGRAVVMIGGDVRRKAKAALERDLGLSELRWISSRPHQSLGDFTPAIAHDDVAVVLLAIRFASHSYGELISECERYGKPFVRLPGGYASNQVAHQILKQASDRLREMSRAT